MEVKVIKNQRIPPLFYKKNLYKQPLACAMFGLLGCLYFLVKFICSGYYESVVIKVDDFIVLGISMFFFGTFLPVSLMLLISSTLVGIIESIVNDNEPEQKSLSENE